MLSPICPSSAPDHPAAALIEAGIADGFTDGSATASVHLPPGVAARVTELVRQLAAAHGAPIDHIVACALVGGVERWAAVDLQKEQP